MAKSPDVIYAGRFLWFDLNNNYTILYVYPGGNIRKAQSVVLTLFIDFQTVYIINRKFDSLKNYVKNKKKNQITLIYVYIFFSPGSIKVSFESVFNDRFTELAGNPLVRALLVEDIVKKRSPYSPLRIDAKTVKFKGRYFGTCMLFRI